MTGTIHRWTITISQIATGVGAYVIGADTVPFDWDAQNIGLSLVWIGVIGGIVSTVLRANLIPGVTTGIGHE